MFAPRGWLSRRFHRQTYRTIASSGLFDHAYYRKRNLSGISKLQDPLWHFVTKGWRAGLSPSPYFDTDYYVTKNDDVRVANLNPLFHYAEYGQAERRLPVRSSLEAQHAATPEASPLRYFITPSVGQKRVSILFDSATDLTDQGVALNILKLASQKAEIESASLRILHRTGALNHISLNEALGGLPLALQDSLEITEVPTSLTYSDLPFFQDETSIATSWSSSFALRYVTDLANSFTVGGPGETFRSSPTSSNNETSLFNNTSQSQKHCPRRYSHVSRHVGHPLSRDSWHVLTSRPTHWPTPCSWEHSVSASSHGHQTWLSFL